jgi:hypothetical protein
LFRNNRFVQGVSALRAQGTSLSCSCRSTQRGWFLDSIFSRKAINSQRHQAWRFGSCRLWQRETAFARGNEPNQRGRHSTLPRRLNSFLENSTTTRSMCARLAWSWRIRISAFFSSTIGTCNTHSSRALPSGLARRPTMAELIFEESIARASV